MVLQAVVVNLCLVDGPALLLGIENLVCEVQLVLDAFEKLLQVQAPVSMLSDDGPAVRGTCWLHLPLYSMCHRSSVRDICG